MPSNECQISVLNHKFVLSESYDGESYKVSIVQRVCRFVSVKKLCICFLYTSFQVKKFVV